MADAAARAPDQSNVMTGAAGAGGMRSGAGSPADAAPVQRDEPMMMMMTMMPASMDAGAPMSEPSMTGTSVDAGASDPNAHGDAAPEDSAAASTDAADDATTDAAVNTQTDAGVEDASTDAQPATDAEVDAAADADTDAAVDAVTDAEVDAALDAAADAAVDAEADAGLDAGVDAGSDAAADAAVDTGIPDAVVPPDGSPGQICASCGGCEERQGIKGSDHVSTPVSYPDPPPTSGNHNPCWARWQIYDTPVRPERWVHNLEHGGVVLLYNCADGCPTELAQLKQFFSTHKQMVLTGYAAMPTKFAIVAWGRRLVTNCVDLAAFDAFYKAYWDHATESNNSQPDPMCPPN